MKTKVTSINPKKFSTKELSEAVTLLRAGEIVAFPTETTYGLGANVFDENAVAKIFVAKSRQGDNPLIVHICDKKQLADVVEHVPKSAELLMEKFWPGPLILVLKKSQKVPINVTGALDSVAIRFSSHQIALALIKESGFPLAAPSANSSGKPSPTTAQQVLEDLDGRIPLIIDGGPCEIGVESTVLSLAREKPVLLRPGKITLEQLRETIGEVLVHRSVSMQDFVENNTSPNEKLLSPGILYTHYSPKAKVVLVLPVKGKTFLQSANKLLREKKAGVISFTKKIGAEEEVFFANDLDAMAQGLFSAFRDFDEKGVEVVVVEGVPEEGLGLAIMNRLARAASEII